MVGNSLQQFVQAVGAAWEPLSSELVARCAAEMQILLEAAETEPWLEALHRDKPDRRELYRDPQHGFLLLGHVEHWGQYRAPHDHGRSWVIYGVQSGSFEMCSYARVEDADGRPILVKRDSSIVTAGDVRVYLPGDIHDTHCLTEDALEFRFTARDLRLEDMLTRYVERDGRWTVAA